MGVAPKLPGGRALTSADIRHLRGEAFDNAYWMRVAGESEPVLDAGEVLVETVAGLRAVHVGAADHETLLASKIASGDWLHAKLAASAAEIVGFDISYDTVRCARAITGREDIYWADATSRTTANIWSQDGPWDLLVVPDTLEHVGDPVLFLGRLREAWGLPCVVTVPNATSRANTRYAAAGEECINSDHRHWYTVYTLAKCATVAGWRPREYAFAMRSTKWLPLTHKWGRYRRHPATRDTVVMTLMPDWG